MPEVVVVGAGLFGSIIAQELRFRGMNVIVVDAEKKGAGSPAAACLMRSSWVQGLGKDILAPALKLLDRHYGVETIKFKTGKTYTDVQFVKPSKILKKADELRFVGGLQPYSGGWRISAGLLGSDDGHLRAKIVIIAAGIWTPNLVPVAGGLSGQAGISFLWPKEHIEEPFIKSYAPYKQLVAFNRGDALWAGDGAAIKQENWTEERSQKCLDRCLQALPKLTTQAISVYGIRPYSKEKPCYLREHEPNLWIATGGSKNGTIAAAYCAQQIAKRLCR